MKKIYLLAFAILAAGCDSKPSSDDIQEAQQEKILAEGASQVGMPGIHNFREKKILKDIFELRDQTGLITYTYIENGFSKIVPGQTALAGKFTFLGESVGYGIPAATQFSNPAKIEGNSSSYVTLPQADPNGLFSPSSAEGTWVLLKDPSGPDAKPVYVEPRVLVSPFKLRMDR